MTAELQLKKVPDQIKLLITREADLNRRSINQEAIVLLEEALTARVQRHTRSRADVDAVLSRYHQLPSLDESARDAIDYDEFGLAR